MTRAFREKKNAPSNWPIGEQTDNRALDGRQSAMLSASLFNGSIVSPLSRPKYVGIALYYAFRHDDCAVPFETTRLSQETDEMYALAVTELYIFLHIVLRSL